MKYKVLAIVVSLNRPELLKRCVEKLKNQKFDFLDEQNDHSSIRCPTFSVRRRRRVYLDFLETEKSRTDSSPLQHLKHR